MLEKFRNCLNKYKDIIVYIIFGGLTTVVSFAVYFPLYNLMEMSGTVCNVISWVAAVAFAFVTNKPFVFHSHDWSIKTTGPELVKFVGARLGSLGIETAIILVFVDMLSFNGNIMKIVTSVIVVILNYIASKLLVFRNKK